MTISTDNHDGRTERHAFPPTPVQAEEDRFPTTALRTTVCGFLVGTAIALAADLAIYVIANRATQIRVVTGWSPEGAPLSVGEVVMTAVAAIIAGAGLLGLLESRAANRWRPWTAIAAVTAVLSAVPLFHLDVSLGSKLSLAAMHLATGAAAIAGHAITRRRGVGRTSPTWRPLTARRSSTSNLPSDRTTQR